MITLAVGKEGAVLALEPNRYVFKVLQKNAQLNPKLTNIIPLCAAATKEAGEFEFNYSDASFSNGGFLSQIEKKRHGHAYKLKVKGVNLQDLLYEQYANLLPKLEMIKIDAEGYDKEILKTIPSILEQFHPNILAECYKRLNQSERYELFDVIHAYGYQLFRLTDIAGTGNRIRIGRENMNDEKHFEILAMHPSRMHDDKAERQ